MKKSLRKRVNHKIINIKRSSRYSDRIVVRLDNKNVFRIPEDVFILKPLHIGDSISRKEIASYDKKMRRQEAKDAAYRLLSFRMRSTWEIKTKLKDKSFTEEEINHTIDFLLKLNYLNDNDFAFTFAKEKIKLKKIGPKLLRLELIKRGIDQDLSTEVIDDCYSHDLVNDLICFHINKRKIEKKALLENKEKKKLTDFLMRKGFDWQSISTVYSEWGLL